MRVGGTLLAGGVVMAMLVACAAQSDVQGDDLPAPTSTVTGRPTPSTPPPPPTLDSADAGAPESSTPCKTTSGGKCGLDPQCGCGMNETCDVTNTSGGVSCVSGGSATLGRPCNQTGDCVAGLTCLYGACRPYCTSARTKCTTAGTQLCIEELDNNNQPLPNKNTCTIACDPLSPSATCGANNCLWFESLYAPEKVSDCNAVGATGLNQPCQTDYDCAQGLACAPQPKRNRNECQKWCHFSPSVANECGSGYSCKDFFGTAAPVFNGVHEGLCQ